MDNPIYFEIEITDYDSEVEFEFKTETEIDFGFDTEVIVTTSNVPIYDGEYEFTPTAETQIVEIANKKATDNITINPIPHNYGLIGWNGAFLTVS